MCRRASLVFEFKHTMMKSFSLSLMLAGWFLVVAAIAMLNPGLMPVFAVAGFGVELLGFALLTRAQVDALKSAARQERRY